MAQETGPGPRERRHHHRAPALVGGAAGRAGRPPVRARPSARRIHGRHRELGADGHVGRRLAARLRLRRPARRGAGRPRGGRADRRLDARQADRARPGRRRVPRPPLPEPLREPQARAHPLRRADLRRRADHRRRHDLPARRRELLRHHHLQRRRGGRAVVLLVAGRLALRRAHSPTSPRGWRRSTSPARARGRSWAAPRPTSTARNEAFAYLDGKQRAGRGRSLPDPAHRLRRRGRLRDPLPVRPRRATCGTRSWRPAPSTGSGPSAWSPSASCACRSCTSSSARTPTPSRRPYGAAMPWIVKLDKDEDFIGKWALEHAAERRRRRLARSSASRCADGDVPTEGAAVLDARRRARRPGHERAPLAPARPRDRHGLGAGRAGHRRRAR